MNRIKTKILIDIPLNRIILHLDQRGKGCLGCLRPEKASKISCLVGVAPSMRQQYSLQTDLTYTMCNSITIFRAFPKEIFRVNNGPHVQLRPWAPQRQVYDIFTNDGMVYTKALNTQTYKGKFDIIMSRY